MTTRYFSDRLFAWFGWCPMTGTVLMTPAGTSVPSTPAMPSGAGGSIGGSGRGSRGLGLFAGSIRILSEHAGFVPYLLLSAVWGCLLLLQFAMAGEYPAGTSLVLPVSGTLPWYAGFWGMVLAVQYGGALLTLGLMYLAAGYAGSGDITFTGSLRSAWQRMDRLNGYILLLSLGTAVPVAIRSLYPDSPGVRLVSAVLDLAVVAFTIASIFVVPVMAFEEAGFAGAMRRSTILLRAWWPELAAGALLTAGILFLIFCGFTVGFVLPAAMQGPAAVMPGIEGNPIFTGGLMVVIAAILLPLSSIFLYGLYFSAAAGTLPPAFAPRAGGSGAGQGSRFVRGWVLVRGSAGLIRRNTAILTLSLLTALAVIVDNEGYRLLDPAAGSVTPQHFAIAFCSYFAGHFVVTFLVAALFSAVALTVAGNVPSAGACLARSRQFLRPIAVWALVITIFQGGDAALRAVYPGMVSEAAGTIVLVGLYTMTIFIVPAILFDRDDVARAIGHSSGIIRKTWPELAGGFAACTLVFLGLALAGVMPVFFISGPEADPGLFGEALFSLLYAGIFIVWEIFIVCMYLHATGRFSVTGAPMPPGGVGNGCC